MIGDYFCCGGDGGRGRGGAVLVHSSKIMLQDDVFSLAYKMLSGSSTTTWSCLRPFLWPHPCTVPALLSHRPSGAPYTLSRRHVLDDASSWSIAVPWSPTSSTGWPKPGSLPVSLVGEIDEPKATLRMFPGEVIFGLMDCSAVQFVSCMVLISFCTSAMRGVIPCAAVEAMGSGHVLVFLVAHCVKRKIAP